MSTFTMDLPMCGLLGLVVAMVLLLIMSYAAVSEHSDPNSDPLESKFASKLY